MRKFLLALLALNALFLGSAQADDNVGVVPDDTTVQASSPTGYTINLTGDTPATQISFLLPGHGRPCGAPDQYGDPIVSTDSDTNWVVTDSAGGIVNDRWVTWDGFFPTPYSIHINVLSSPLGGCFYVGATAQANTTVVGLAQGAPIFNDQSVDFGTRGDVSFSSKSDRSFTVKWRMWNGTNNDVTLKQERMGVPSFAKFPILASNFDTNPDMSNPGVYLWKESLIVPANSEITKTITLQRPCGKATKALRLRITRSDGLTAGTGDGVIIPLAKNC